MTKDTTKGPDNNKDFQRLEAEEQTVAAYLKAEGVEDLGGRTPIEALIVRTKSLAEGNAALHGLEAEHRRLEEYMLEHHVNDINGSAIDTALKLLDAAKAGTDGVSPGELAAIERAEKAEKELAEAKAELGEIGSDVEQLTAAKNELANKVAELNDVIAGKGYAPPAAEPEPEPEPTPRERPEHARDFGPGYRKLSREKLGALIEAGAGFEIAFSNGAHELVELAPVAIAAADLASVEGRRMVDPAILVLGGQYREEIHGAALVHAGKQVAYCEFPSPVAIEPKQQRQFTRAIVFG